jgi:hypothetical protein
VIRLDALDPKATRDPLREMMPPVELPLLGVPLALALTIVSAPVRRSRAMMRVLKPL